ncbi:TIGR02611 family protein [Microbacterium sp. SS28]|uniref:TIGR02611 family protein n=1 Tax=Microbacterium sp. SS28 TaxID=2919948 RepID=UPI001FAA6462|nr:TIGR02611 family protein [Microbacterium sp. SS28]
MTLTAPQASTSQAPTDAVRRGEVAASAPDGEQRDHAVFRRLARMRAWVTERPRLELAYRAVVAVIGVTLTLVGIVLLALPGPGWITVFLGLAVLGTEFHWARRISAWLKVRLDRAWTWWRARRARRKSSAVGSQS